MPASQPRLSGKELPCWWLAGLPSRLHWIFLVFATPLVIFLALWTPPFQSADEPAHFYRAYQVAQGGFYGGSGGYTDPAIQQLDDYVFHLRFHHAARFTRADQAGVASVRWTGQPVYRPFPNTAPCAPTGYLPQALGVALGKALGMNVERTLELARLCNGAFAVSVCALAIFWCRNGKLLMFAMLLLPMTLSLFASSSQDATLIALTCLAFAVISKQVAEGAPLSPAQTVLVVLSLLIVALGRPPYAALLLVLFTPGLLPHWRNLPSWLPGMILAGLSIAVVAAWWLGAPPLDQSFVLASGKVGVVNAKLQLLNLIHHPGIVVPVSGFAIGHAAEYIAATIGILGWLDTPLPSLYYLAMLLVLLLACAAEFAQGARLKKSTTAILLLSPFATLAAVFLIEYLTWTPVGAPAIHGVQGRYFIPLAIAAGVGLPRLGRQNGVRHCWPTVVVILSQLLTVVCLPQVIMGRYYQP